MDEGDGCGHGRTLPGVAPGSVRPMSPEAGPSEPTGSGRWAVGAPLLGLALIGIAVRLLFAVAVAPDLPLPGDAQVYREMAHNLAEGRGLSTVAVNSPTLQPSAEHPPGFPSLLALLDLVGLDEPAGQRAALAVVAALGVLLVGLVAQRVAGRTAGQVAAAIAAVHPLWVQSPGVIMSETVHLVLVPAVLLGGLWLVDHPTARAALAFGCLVGVAALVRPEALGLAAVVGVPAVWSRPRWREGGRLVLLVGVGVLLVVTPWLVRNERELDAVVMATNSGKTLLGSNCDASYAGPGLGGFDYDCFFGAATALVQLGPPGGGTWNGADFDDEMGDAGWRFIREHERELPKVIVARVVRMWGLAFAGDQLAFDVREGRSRGWQAAGQAVHLGVLPLAVAGTVALWRRPAARRATVLLLGPVVLVTGTTLLVYGGTRMRTGAEPSLAVLAGVAVGILWDARRGRGRCQERTLRGGSLSPR